MTGGCLKRRILPPHPTRGKRERGVCSKKETGSGIFYTENIKFVTEILKCYIAIGIGVRIKEGAPFETPSFLCYTT